MKKIGHFGLPALLAGGLAVLALVLHLAVPYATVEFMDPESGETDKETFSRGDIADDFDSLGGPNASPGLTLTGIVVAMIGGLGLVFASFLPLKVTQARTIGWGLGALTAIGAAIAFVSSMWWVGSGFGVAPPSLYFSYFETQSGGEGFGGGPFAGTDMQSMMMAFAAFGGMGLTGGFSGVLEMIFGTDNAGDVWIISPVFVAAIALVILLAGLRACGDVVARADGLREQARRNLNGGALAIGFLGLALLVPWSIGELTDTSGEDQDYFVFGARTVLSAEDDSDGDIYSSMAYGLTIFQVAAWVGLAVALLSSLGPLLRSLGTPAQLVQPLNWTSAASALLWAWSAVVYLMTWIYMWRPYEDAEGFQPGYFPLVLLPLLALWGFNQWGILKQAKADGKADLSPPPALSFD
ncbi:MAG: hypothetical protein ACPGQL_10145 [Thermoplasmatota archaeon]